MIDPSTLTELRGSDLPTIRRHVRGMLEATPSFRQMGGPERTKLARSMVQVLSFLTDPRAGVTKLAGAAEREQVGRALAMQPPAAGALDVQQQQLQDTKARDDLQKRLAQRPDQVGNQMKGNVAGQTGDIMKSMVAAVDFPKFVSSLIEGVFTSIVNSSIRQMHEFSKYLNAVAMTLQDFAAQNSNLDEGREYLASKNPRTLTTEARPNGTKRLRKLPSADDEDMPDFKSLLGLVDDVDLDDDDSEAKVAESAQLQVARMRQQQLATMVLMGINRIVVTEGEIKATVTFDVMGTETAHSDATATSDDTQTHSDYAGQYQYKRSNSFWGTDSSGSGSSSSDVNTRVSTAHAQEQNVSDAHLESKAKLTGYVQVKFKSETFPLEKLANQTEMAAVQERSQR
ncbi:MAG TPA: hypothetical protein VLM79_14155 [Kofleriaceae bacterium]|nr:hypothetical protein [Kofleriaceae bacterium]